MSRFWASIPDEREGKPLALYLRGVLNTTGLTVDQVAKAAQMSRSGVSQTIDGRLPKWSTISYLLTYIRAAADKEGCTDLLPPDLTLHAKALWDECDARRHLPDQLNSARTSPPPDTAADPPPCAPVGTPTTDAPDDEPSHVNTRARWRRGLWRKLTRS